MIDGPGSLVVSNSSAADDVRFPHLWFMSDCVGILEHEHIILYYGHHAPASPELQIRAIVITILLYHFEV